jgi:hypothetical protein
LDELFYYIDLRFLSLTKWFSKYFFISFWTRKQKNTYTCNNILLNNYWRSLILIICKTVPRIVEPIQTW